MDDNNYNQKIEAARQELTMVQAELDTLRARKSIAECIRETFSQTQPVQIIKRKVRRRPFGSKEEPQVEVTILETDFQRLKEQVQSTDWIKKKLSELKHLGDSLWQQMNQKAILQDAIHRAESAEICCRSLQKQIEHLTAQLAQEYDQDDGADREIDYPQYDDREL
ncbi:MAG: hypothetical protein MSS60_06055 [Clostridiales bacterium]|nr:hypothetical protein [Clostridiales bacterium]